MVCGLNAEREDANAVLRAHWLFINECSLPQFSEFPLAIAKRHYFLFHIAIACAYQTNPSRSTLDI
jgi:hypothetical protein